MKHTTILAILLFSHGCSTSDDSAGGALLRETCGPKEVHVFGVYETRSDHRYGDHPVGEGRVTIERPGQHALVLSAYEPTNWRLTLAPGATIESIHLIGYHAQTVDVTGVPITYDTYEQGGTSACGYSLPYNGEGCDTDALLALAEARAGAPLTTFHGCYHAPDWTLHADGTATSTCDRDAGYEEFEFIRDCDSSDWEREDFKTETPAECAGDRFVRFDQNYGVWIGAISCDSADTYKLYMSERRDGTFLDIADFSGYGQDHCGSSIHRSRFPMTTTSRAAAARVARSATSSMSTDRPSSPARASANHSSA